MKNISLYLFFYEKILTTINNVSFAVENNFTFYVMMFISKAINIFFLAFLAQLLFYGTNSFCHGLTNASLDCVAFLTNFLFQFCWFVIYLTPNTFNTTFSLDEFWHVILWFFMSRIEFLAYFNAYTLAMHFIKSIIF